MQLTPATRKLVDIVAQAHEGKVCLPNFQRDFVWPRDQIADLLRSILRRYYVGSLLFLRCDPNSPPFSPKELRGAAPKSTTLAPEFLVLDGQQRLTSLVYALHAPKLSLKDSSRPRRFFVDLEKLRATPEDDEIVFDRALNELDGLDRVEVQYERRILPCTDLSWHLFDKWLDGFEDWLHKHEPKAVETYKSELRPRWKEAIHAFSLFEVPVIELPLVNEADKSTLAQVCAIFEKLNSTGVELSVYDLLTARLYRSGIHLHKLWDEACEKHERLRTWSGGKADKNKFGVLMLRTIALLRDQEVRPRVLIDLAPEGFVADWHRAAAAIERALQLIQHVGPDGFGVFDQKWLPGFGLLPVLAALKEHIDSKKLGDDARSSLRRWYWCNVFLERYSSAVESKSRKDYQEMLRLWSGESGTPSVFSEAQSRIGSSGFTVRHSASHASAIYCGVFCLLAARGARDWSRAESIQLQQLEDHHIFPKAYLKRSALKARIDVNSIVNRTLISDETNRKILDQPPAEYVSDTDVFPKGPSADILDAHFIDAVGLKAMQAAIDGDGPSALSAYEAFRNRRERLILSEIRKVCGIAEPSTTTLSEDSAAQDSEDEDAATG
ncbi:MAG: DUF262 domain-containing protein [Deltaproteobacteria bacterium]|nr:DUF262 domain-containing protein [Deltaproteobacteria bacterium]